MFGFLGALLRILIGFTVACLVAGFIQVLFAVTPTELVAAGEQRLFEAFNWGLLTSTQLAVFSWPLALIAIAISEWQGVRSFAYHALVGMIIAAAGFGLILATEAPDEASIVNSYAMAAYLTSGFLGGFAYWLFSGRKAFRGQATRVAMESSRRPMPDKGRKQGGRPRAPLKSTGTVPATKPDAPKPEANKPAPPPKTDKPVDISQA